MRTILMLSLLLLFAACQSGPADPSPGRDSTVRKHYGGMCSPYASNCW
jgi:hypothetical protein